MKAWIRWLLGSSRLPTTTRLHGEGCNELNGSNQRSQKEGSFSV